MRDFGPLGSKCIEMSQILGQEAVDNTRRILNDKALRAARANGNYAIGLRCFSYSVARRKLEARLANLLGEAV